jgi:hypothetical protein
MKITNISNKRIYLADLKVLHESQTEGRRGEDIYLDPPGTSPSHVGPPYVHTHIYLPETSEVLRSASHGDIRKFRDGDPLASPPIAASITVDDTVPLNNGVSVTINHWFHRQPNVTVLKQVGPIWKDATGMVDIAHDVAFTQVTVTNTIGVNLVFLIKVS